MATAALPRRPRAIEYPTSDGKPMAETDHHRDVMIDQIESLKLHYAPRPEVYVSGNLLLFYEEGNRRKHISPDVFVVRGVGMRRRDYYLLWEEKKSPEVIFEITSKTTKREDQIKKRKLYRDVLKVKEYFLFDPFEDYLDPSMQGYRLRGGDYHTIHPVNGRLPSQVLGLHLERDGQDLRLYDPTTGKWVPTPRELAAQEKLRADIAEVEIVRLREELRKVKGNGQKD
jgi:Uma2 family endonuclease